MFLTKTKDFINSTYFIYAVAVVVFAVWFTGWEIAGLAVLALAAATSLLFQRNCSAFAAICCLASAAMSRTQITADVEGSIFTDNIWLAAVIAVLGLYVVFCVVYHLIKFPNTGDNKFNLTGSFILILVAIMTAGLLSDNFSMLDNLQVFAAYGLCFALYLVFSSGGIPDFKRFFAHIMIAIGFVVLAECAVYYLRCDDIMTVLRDKWLNLGWGITNNIATVLCFSVVMSLYMYTDKNNVAYFIFALLFAGGTALTLSRGNLLGLGLSLPFLAYFTIAKSQNRKKSAILVGVAAAIIVIVAIWQWEMIAEIFEKMFDRGLDDNGRVELWGAFTQMFKENPFFGYGFYDAAGKLYMPHAVLLIIASAMGFWGLLAFGCHYYKKYLVLVSYKSTFSCFATVAAFIFAFYSVMDMSFHMVFQLILVYAFLEAAKQEMAEVAPQRQPLAPFKKYAAVWLAVGIALTALSTMFMFGALKTEEGVGIILPTLSYGVSLVGYIAGGVCFFGAAEVYVDKIKQKIKGKGDDGACRQN